MTTEERGMFREAIDYCYREGSLPDDRRKLIAILACTEEEFERSFPAVQRLFTKAEGRFEHHRVSEVLRALENCREQKRKAGEVSGLSRGKKKPKAGEVSGLSRGKKKPKANERPFNGGAAPYASFLAHGLQEWPKPSAVLLGFLIWRTQAARLL
jgi:uncharacterized protein YdaU (DUF1376 family)